MVATAANKQGAWGLLRPLLVLAVIAGPSLMVALRDAADAGSAEAAEKTTSSGQGGSKAAAAAASEQGAAGSEIGKGAATGSETKPADKNPGRAAGRAAGGIAAEFAAEDAGGEEEEEEEEEDPFFPAQGNASAAARAAAATVRFPWQNASLPVEERVEALLARLTPKQKIAQLQSRPGNGIPGLGVPAFAWQEECLHGVKVGKSGVVQPLAATIYPLNIAWAATFDDELAQRAASQIGDEMRAHYNRRAREGWTELAYTNCFGPHVHIVRDPRWGRLGETFGEDPMLQANMAVAHVTGLQGGDGTATYLKASATCKHFIGNDLEGWQGATRHNIDANISAADMRDSFMPPFEACVQRARAGSIMCSYNRVNGVPSCINRELLTDTLFGKMGFDGFVVTDCTAINRMVKPPPEGPWVAEGNSRRASALAVKAGTSMACHVFNRLFSKDLEQGELDEAARRVLRARVRQGHFNLVRDLPFPHLNASHLGHPSHKATARELAAKGSVLLKNEGGMLPLNPEKLTRLAVLGPYANEPGYIMGKYFGATVEPITTPLQALQAALPHARVTYNSETALVYTTGGVAQDAEACEAADACILFLGSRMSASQRMWTELTFDKHAYDTLAEGEGHDRTTLLLQAEQEKLWQKVASLTTKPLIVVLVHGGPLDVSSMVESPRVGAILSIWHPGQHGSVAVADLLLGKASPSGRTPVTWYKESYCKKLPMIDMRMRASAKYPGRTYRYWKGEEPLFPFGYGLSYARWSLSKPAVSLDAGADELSQPGGADASPLPVTVATAAITVRHTGGVPADTSVLLFMRYLGPAGSAAAKGAAGAPSATVAASGCTAGSARTDLVQRLVGYRRSGQLEVGGTARLSFPLQLGGGSRSSWAGFGDPAPPCGAYALSFGHDDPNSAVVVLA
ncbi:hypothetical protein ABPG75_000621 [Micractinium tetrahymenae]